MKRLALAVMVISLAGCGSFEKRTRYQYSGLVIVTDTEVATRAKCANGRRACYFATTKEAYVVIGDQEAVLHEFCHYFCHEAAVPDEEIKACNVRCDTDDWQRLID